ncbi:cell division protein ZapB [Candidatus Enterovibrio altilux]|nr:cell division protein ZapB [Candidatus Enterovibrio luxaltus]
MSLEILEQLEAKVQMVVDTVSLLHVEIAELKVKNEILGQESDTVRKSCDVLEQENAHLRTNQNAWQQRICSLLSKIEEIE